MATQSSSTATPFKKAPKGRFVPRYSKDRSQIIRHSVQWAFVLLNAWVGLRFFLWVRYFERGGTGYYLPRPAGIEGWLPIAGLMNTKYLLSTGHVPAIHPAAMYLFLGFVLISTLLKKAFCSWLCPVGTLSENLWKLGRRLFKANLRLPKWFDVPLRSFKYVLLAFFLATIGSMSAEALDGFLQSPYGIVVDVRMINFFRDVSGTAAVIIAVLIVMSILVENFWCRYLCPYGALLGMTSLLSPVKIRRDAEACIDCGKCARVCPAHLPVDQLVQVRSAECSACMACVASCSAQNALQFSLPPRKIIGSASRWRRRGIPPAAVAAVIAYIFFGTILWARATNHWHTNVLPSVYLQLVQHANDLRHSG